MAKLDFNIGSEVHCKDRSCGKLLKVVVDPDVEKITDLIVRDGLLLKTDRVVPAALVERATEEEIHLLINSDQLESYPQYREDEVEVPKPDWEREQVRRAEEAKRYSTIYGVAYREKLMPTVAYTIHTGVRSDRVVVERGVPVKSSQTTVGELDHILVDIVHLQVTHLIVNPGLFSHSLVMPVSMVDRVSEDGIYVQATEEELTLLPQYKPRDESEVLAELEERLDAAPVDSTGVSSTFVNGVLRLTGVVPDVAAKRQAEAIARSLEGVIDVENALTTDTSIVAHITASLTTDHRTDVAVVGVINERGVVTLKGQVDDPNTREAAEEIARRQPGVVDVINELEVEIDDVTELLRFRMMLREQGFGGPRTKPDRIDE
jgi:hypothetical protein